MERDLDHASMCHQQDVTVLVLLKDLVHRGRHSRVERGSALAVRNDVPVGLFHPTGPCLRISRCDLLRRLAFPLAEIDLPQRGPRLGLEMDCSTDQLRGLERALQVAGVKASEAPAGQSRSEQGGLAAALVGEWRIELTLDAVLLIPDGLAVADQNQPRGRRASW